MEPPKDRLEAWRRLCRISHALAYWHGIMGDPRAASLHGAVTVKIAEVQAEYTLAYAAWESFHYREEGV